MTLGYCETHDAHHMAAVCEVFDCHMPAFAVVWDGRGRQELCESHARHEVAARVAAHRPARRAHR